MCSQFELPEIENWPTAKGLPTEPTPMLGCSRFESQSEAQVWFDFFKEDFGDFAGLDGNLDGKACSSVVGSIVSSNASSIVSSIVSSMRAQF